MDQIFVVDTMQTQRVLDVICSHLQLEYLLKLEHVTRQSRAAVRAHHYDRELLYLGLSDVKLTRQLIGNDGSQLRGPILTRVFILARFDPENIEQQGGSYNHYPNPYNMDWLLMTIRQRAPHIRQFETNLSFNSYVLSQVACQELNRRAQAALARVTFDQCTKVMIKFEASLAESTATGLLPDLLRHFPAVEHLELDGSRPPLLSALPAPHKLKSLLVNFWDLKKPTKLVIPLAVDFSRLESFTVSLFESHLMISEYDYPSPEFSSSNLLAQLNRLTGVDWVASFEHHPPTRLRHVSLPILTNWTLPLLAACSLASPSACRSLAIHYLVEIDPQLAATLCVSPVDQVLKRVTRFTGGCFGERAASDHLAFTPSLAVLDLKILDREPFDLVHPLPSLTKLILSEGFDVGIRSGWVESIRRNAPPGLEVVIKNEP